MPDDQFDASAAVDAFLASSTPTNLKTSLALTAGQSPDYEAETRRLGQTLGLPPQTVASNIDDARKQASLATFDADSYAQKFPTAAKFLADPNNAAIAHDNKDSLGGIENSLSFLWGSAKAGVNDLAGAGAKLLDAVQPFTLSDQDAAVLFKNQPDKLRQMRDTSLAMGLSRFARGRTAASQQNMKDISPGAQATYGSLQYATTDPDKAAYLSPVKMVGDAIRSLPTTAALALTAYLTRGASVQAEKQALASGMEASAAHQVGVDAAVSMATKFGAASEGTIGYAQQALQTQNQIEGTPIDKLAASPAYQQLVAQGFDPSAARIYLAARGGEQAGIGAGAVDAVTNMIGGQWLGKIISEGGSLLPRLGKGFANEGLVEFVQSGGEQVFQNMAVKDNADPKQSISDGVLESMLQGLAVGGLTGGAFSGVIGRGEHNKQKAQDAEQGAARIETLNKLAAADKLLQRSPDDFQSFIASAAENGPVNTVYLDGKALLQSGMAPRLADISPSVRDQLDRAILTGGDVAIPVDEYATKIAPTDIAPQLLGHLKTEPDGFTRAEAQDFMVNHASDMQAEVERILTDRQDADVFRQSQDAVKQDILGQLNTARRFTPQVNEAYATLASSYGAVRADQLGITPEEFHQQHGMKVQGVAVAGQRYAQAMDLPYQINHKPMTSEGGASTLDDLTQAFGEDIYGKDALQYFGSGDAREQAVVKILKSLRGKPDAEVTIYRGVPDGVGKINPGDWVTLSKEAAEDYASQHKGGRIVSMKVPAHHVTGWADSLLEFGYYPAKEGGTLNQSAPTLDTVRQQWDAAGITHDMSEKNGAITLSRIVVPEADRGAGKGTAAIQSLVDYADRTGQRVMLTPAADFGGNKKRLVELYKRFGFVENKGKNKDFTTQERMIREPKLGAAQSSTVQTDTPEFKNWFGDSKVVDDQGNPLVVYHGTNDRFTKVNFKKGAQSLFWFTSDRTSIESGDAGAQGSSKIMALYAKIENPAGWKEYDKYSTDELRGMGYDGVILPDSDGSFNGFIFKDAAQVKSTKNSGTFDPNDPNILHQSDGGSAARGAFSPDTNTVTLLKNADLSTFLHESAHYFFENDIGLAEHLVIEARNSGMDTLNPGEQQIVDDVSKLLAWHGIQGDIKEQLRQWYAMDFEEQRSHHERTAESFEAYLFSGKAPSLELQPVFQRFASWMFSIYQSLKDFIARNPEAGKLNPEVRQVFDRMLATREEISLAEQARSMLPLFNDPAKSGMTPDEFAAYQAQGKEATATAVDELQAKGMRDMQWLANARGRQVDRLKRESRALRSEVQIEARREVMSQPVYQAWDFLTRKLGKEDTLPPLERKSSPDVLDPALDSLFVAIAKLGGIRKDQAVSEWGIDSKGMPQSGLFGKPVWRLTNGLPIDTMASALAENGYLPLNKHGQYELNDLEERFREELGGHPQYSNAHDPHNMQAGDQIVNPAGLDAGRLDLGALAEMGMPEEVINAVKAYKMTAKEGLHPDLAASIFDFSSGDELVRSLAAAQPPKDAITQLTDRMMLERHGELATPVAIELAADAAIHNDARARMVATEYNALAQATGKPRLLASVAKEYAAAIISKLKIKDIQPSQYANAETRAAKASMKASAKGDLATAAAEKRNQAVNLYATRAAYDAKDEVTQALAYIKRRVTSATSQKNMRGEAQAQLLALLDRFDLRKSVSAAELDRKQSLADWAVGEADRLAAPIPLLSDAAANESVKTHYKNLTVEEFRGLIDSIKQLEHLARREHEAYIAIRNMTLQQEVSGSIAEIREAWPDAFDADGKAIVADPLNHRYAKTFGDRLTDSLRHLNAEFVPMEELIGQLTAGKFGLVHESLFGRISSASDRKSIMAGEIRDMLKPVYDDYSFQEKRDFSRKVIGNTGMTRENLLMLALYYGNIEGRQRLASQGFNDQTTLARLSHLSEKDLNLAEAIWSLNDNYIWPQYAALNERTQGKAPAKVKAVPFTVGGRTVGGGYVKLVYDSQFDETTRHRDSMADAMAMIGGRANPSTKTNQGSSIERVQEISKMPLLELRAMSQAVNEHMHDIAYREAIADTVRVLRFPDMANTIKAVAGKEIYTELMSKINEVAARPADPSSMVLKGLNIARKNTVVVLMSGIKTALVNYSGMVPALFDNRINAGSLVKNIARVHSLRMREMVAYAMEKSIYMRERNQQFTADLQHEMAALTVKNRLMPEMGTFLIMMRMIDQLTSTSVWLAAYETGNTKFSDDMQAIEYANSTVRSTQASGRDVDTSKIMTRFGAWSKPFLMFYSYFNQQLALLVRSGVISKQQWERGNHAKAIGQFTAAYISIVVIPALINDMAAGNCDSAFKTGDGWGKCIAKAISMNMAGYIPVVRDLAPYAWSMLDDSEPNWGLRSTALSAYFEGIVKGTASAVKVAEDRSSDKDTKSIFMGLSFLVGMPGKLMWDVTAGTESVINKDAPPQSILFGPPKH